MQPLPANLRVPLTPDLEERLGELGRAQELDRVAAAWLAQASLSYRLDLDPEADVSEVARSRYGGAPDLPVDMDWPRGPDGAFVFVQQVNLAEVPAVDGNPLPRSGLLSLFIEDDESSGGGGGSFHVFYSPDAANLVRAEWPSDFVPTYENYNDLRPTIIRPVPTISLPMCGPNFEEAQERLGDQWQKLYDLETAAFGAADRESHGGRLLGHPYGVQSDQITHAILLHHGKRDLVYAYYKSEADLRAGLEEAKQAGDEARIVHQQRIVDAHGWLQLGLLEKELGHWLPLWQVESNFTVGTCFWDAGTLSMYALADDVAGADFSRVYTELESS